MPVRETPSTRHDEQSSVAPRVHLSFLDGIRGLASLYVLLHHVWLASYPRQAGGSVCGICLDAPDWSNWLKFGHLAVAVFIVVSGFSLALSAVRHGDQLPEGYVEYMRRRAFRILPPYWIALVLSCFVVLFTGQYTGIVIDARAVAVHGLLLNNLIDSAKPNGTFWSIAVEWQIYFVFPLLLLLCRRFGASAMVLATCFCVVVSYLLGSHHAWIAARCSSAGQPEASSEASASHAAVSRVFALGVLAAHATALRTPNCVACHGWRSGQ